MIYLAKGKNIYSHVEGVNVWYMTKAKHNLNSKNLSTEIFPFPSNKINNLLLFCRIHSGSIGIVDLG